jgi:hypothetical protein
MSAGSHHQKGQKDSIPALVANIMRPQSPTQVPVVGGIFERKHTPYQWIIESGWLDGVYKI